MNIGNDSQKNVISAEAELLQKLSEQITPNRLPKHEQTVVRGNPPRYPRWRYSFDTFARSMWGSKERLYYLQSYLAGSVK